MGKDSFIIHSSFYKPIAKLSDKQLGRLFRAIFNYHIDGAVTVEEDIEMAFAFFVNQFEIDESKYQSKVERNRECGRKGGRPKISQVNESNLSEESERLENNRTVIKSTEETERLENNRTVINPTEKSERLENNRTVKIKPYNDNDNVNDNDIIKKEKDKKEIGKVTPEIAEAFGQFYKLYPGRKNGCDRTLREFIKKRPADYAEIIPKLLPALMAELEWNEKAGGAGMFVPETKNLNTWLNQECWDQVHAEIKPKPNHHATTTPIATDGGGAEARAAVYAESIARDLAGLNDSEPDVAPYM